MGYVILLWHSLSLPYNYFLFRMSTRLNSPNYLRNIKTRMISRPILSTVFFALCAIKMLINVLIIGIRDGGLFIAQV